METIKTLVLYIQKKFGLKAKTEEKEEEVGGYSMNEGKPDKVFGFRREVVKGVVVFFGTVLVLAFIFATNGKDEYKQEKGALPSATESEIADVRKPKTLPNDYETLMAMNKAKEDELRRQAEENARKATNNQSPEQPATKVVENPVPAIPERKVLPSVVQMPILPEESPAVAPVKADNNPKTDEGKYKSAISFALGEGSNQESSPSDSLKTETKNSPRQVKTEYHAPDNSTLGAGTVIAVRLLTGIDTSVEGQVMAQVLADVYDTATGTKLLIPQGSQLIGSYDKKSVGNGRVPVTFRQLMLPDGGSWTILENMVAIDGAGYTGIAGKVHHHTGQKISAGMIGASIAAMGSLAAGNVSSSNETYTAGQIAMHGAVADLIDSTSEMFKEASKIENTVTIEPGYEFNVYVTENITF